MASLEEIKSDRKDLKKSTNMRSIVAKFKCLDCGKIFNKIGGILNECPICHSENLLEVDEEDDEFWREKIK